MTNALLTAAAALCLVAAILSAGAASARPVESQDNTKTEAVPYGDLDISQVDGAQALYARIRSAARNVCNGPPIVGDFEDIAQFHQCFAGSVDQAVDEVHSPLVRSAADADNHRPADIASP